MSRIIDKGEIAEIKEFYDGTYSSIFELSFNFRVSPGIIARIVNHKNANAKMKKCSEKWRKKHPLKVKKMMRAWYEKNKEKVATRNKERYWNNVEKSRKISREKARKHYHKKLKTK